MPSGPKGERRSADVIGNAVHVIRIATGEIEDTVLDDGIAPASPEFCNWKLRPLNEPLARNTPATCRSPPSGVPDRCRFDFRLGFLESARRVTDYQFCGP
jgi:hypothetical protein